MSTAIDYHLPSSSAAMRKANPRITLDGRIRVQNSDYVPVVGAEVYFDNERMIVTKVAYIIGTGVGELVIVYLANERGN